LPHDFSLSFDRLVIERSELEYNIPGSDLQGFSNVKKRHICYRLMLGASVPVSGLHPQGIVRFPGVRIRFRK
jgi:hypothetical protein